MLYRNDNVDCEWFYYEPSECKKFLLFGYHYNCGSQECKKKRKEYESQRKDKRYY